MAESDFKMGCEHARDLCLATIIGIQNGIGNEKLPEYQALQAAYNQIVKNTGICSPRTRVKKEDNLAKPEESIKKIPGECVETVNTYADLIYFAVKGGKQQMRDEYAKKLRGYLACLKDLKLIDESDMRNLNLWVCTGHWIGVKAGKIYDPDREREA